MSEPQRLSSDHRGTRALQTLIERAPATGSLALWMQHDDVAALDVAAPIATDGRRILYAPEFESLDTAVQVGWVAHQTLHVAFRHVARREALRKVLGDVDDVLYNACADALVNSTLAHLSWLALPSDALYVEKLVQRALQRELSVDAALAWYDVERLYREIDDRVPRGGRSSSSGNSARDATGKGGGDNTRGGQGTVADEAANSDQELGGSVDRAGEGGLRADGPRSATTRAMHNKNTVDLLAGDGEERPEDAAQAVRDWSDRLTRGHASDGAFSLLRTLGADLPRSRVPWQQILRRRLASALVREPETSWSRPARSWLANQGRDRKGRKLPFEPGTTSARQVPRLVVVLDISGSIDSALLGQLSAQLNAIARRTRSRCTVVIGDDQVRHVATLGSATSGVLPNLDLTDFSLEGGGGTNFVPLLEEAARHQPDCAIVLTDLDGPAGERPRFPVLWAVPPQSATMPVPFGEMLVID